VKSVVNTSGAGDAIVLQPAEMLQPETAYTFEITRGLKDTNGTASSRTPRRLRPRRGAQRRATIPFAFDQDRAGADARASSSA
jgi:hypothetical protein